MINNKKIMMIILVLTLVLVTTGCSDDGTSDFYSDDIIKSIEGPKAIIQNDTNPVEFSVETNITNPSYQWIVQDDKLAEFENPNQAQTVLNAKDQNSDKVNIRASVSDGVEDVYSDWIPVRILGEKNETVYGADGPDAFHAIVTAQDSGYKGFVAAGYNGKVDETEADGYQKDAYVVKANNRGVERWSEVVDGGGYDDRFVGIEDIVAGFYKDEYFLIGYQGVTGDEYEGYIMRVNRDGELSKEYTDLKGERVFLRGATVDDYLVVVGNNGSTTNATGYIAKIDPDKKEDTVKKTDYSFKDDNYTNLYAIEKTVDDNYIISGFSGSKKSTSTGFVAIVDSNLNQISKTINLGSRIYNIKELSNDNYIVTGSEGGNGYIAKIDNNGKKIAGFTFDSMTEIRDVIELDSGFILVGKNETEGVAIKIDNSGTLDESFAGNGIFKAGNYFHAATTSEDAECYLLAGSKNSDAYVVKIDITGNIVNRNLN
ncbi:MAG: hypothetical protein ACQEP9_06220 [Bacillota bacterium]